MPKRAQLAQIHIAKKELGLDDATYRAILRELFRKDSAAELTDRQAAELLAHFRGRGWRPRRTGARPSTPRQRGLIRYLWQQLEARGEIDHPGEAALRSFVLRMTGEAELRRLDVLQASRVIEGLKKWQERAEQGAGKDQG